EPAEHRPLSGALVVEALVPLHVVRVLLRRPLEPAVRAEVVQAVMLTLAIEEAADRHSCMAVAEMVRHGVAEALAGAGTCGPGKRPGEGEDRGHNERQRPDENHLAYPEHHLAPASAPPPWRARRSARQVWQISN